MTKLDWLLVLAWVLIVGFIGPWLISAPSWIAVSLGFALLIGLVAFTFKRIKHYYEEVK